MIISCGIHKDLLFDRSKTILIFSHTHRQESVQVIVTVSFRKDNNLILKIKHIFLIIESICRDRYRNLAVVMIRQRRGFRLEVPVPECFPPPPSPPRIAGRGVRLVPGCFLFRGKGRERRKL